MTIDPRRRALAAWALPAAAFVFTRTYAIRAMPPFCDEILALTRADWASHRTPLRGLAMLVRDAWLHGHLLFPWVLGQLSPSGAWGLALGRFLSALAGAAAIACLALAARRFGRPRAGLLCAWLWILCPFTLLHDRLALDDSWVAAAAAAAILTSAGLAGAGRSLWLWAVAAALLIPLAVAVKPSGLILVFYPLVAVALLAPRARRAWLAAGLAALAGLVLAAPLVANLAGRTTEGWKVAQGGSGPVWADRAGGAALAAGWLWAYWTPPLAVAGAAGLAHALLRRRRLEPALALMALLPAAVFVLVFKKDVLFPRYFAAASPAFLLLAAVSLLELARAAQDRLLPGSRPGWRRAAAGLGAAVLLAPAARFDLALLADPARAPFVELDRQQYVAGITSGYAGGECAEFLQDWAAGLPGGLDVIVCDDFDRREIDYYLRWEMAAGSRVVLAWPAGEELVDVEARLAALAEPGRDLAVVQGVWGEKGEFCLERAYRDRVRAAGRLVAEFAKPSGTYRLQIWRLPNERRAFDSVE